MTTELILSESTLPAEYQPMLEMIAKIYPFAARASRAFHKSHSQAQNVTIDAGPVGGFRPLRNMRWQLAVIERTRDALAEVTLDVRAKRAEADAMECLDEQDEIRRERLLLHVQMAQRSVEAAVRKLASHLAQFAELRNKFVVAHGYEPTEADFEADEEAFLIETAFRQALVAARSSGRVDHGNMIFFDDIGINGRLAQEEISTFLRREAEQRKDNHEAFADQIDWLHAMSVKYAGCVRCVTEHRGMLPFVSIAALGGES